MPLRDFKCRSCAAVVEVLTRRGPDGVEVPLGGDENDPSRCTCGASGAAGLAPDDRPARTSFDLRGSGWFRTGGY